MECYLAFAQASKRVNQDLLYPCTATVRMREIFLYTEAYNIWENRDKTPGLSFWASRKWIVFRNCGPVYIVSMDNFGYNKKDLRQ